MLPTEAQYELRTATPESDSWCAGHFRMYGEGAECDHCAERCGWPHIHIHGHSGLDVWGACSEACAIQIVNKL